ncbi:MAG TPA: TIM barrel protein [Victivallales bacterium]|nr:TIM barrel protein [Victivallales bacterium]HRR06034.1 TIM barrel protein [Victivallales bacterium]HRU01557.1 TIM barrel protein [Victivallales bacterium]
MKRKNWNLGPVTLRSMPFWCVANPLGDPFGETVLPKIDSLETAMMIAKAANEGLIEATSFHDDDLVSWDPKNPEDDLDPKSETYKKLRQIKKVLDDAGISVNTATCSLHVNKIFRKGGLTNPDPQIRKLAREKVERTLRIGALFKAKYYTYWVARDGFEVPVAVDWKNSYKWLKEGLDHVYDYIQEKKLKNYIGATIEPKPNEPRGHMFLPTSGHAVGFICGSLKNPKFWGVNPELLQHESMALMNAVQALGYLISMKKLSFIHFGSQIKAQFDNDFPPLVGPEGLKETVQMFWILNELGWKGVVEFDCHMLRTEAEPEKSEECRLQFIRNCSKALSIVVELSSRLRDLKTGNSVKSETSAEYDAIMRLCALSNERIEKLTISL